MWSSTLQNWNLKYGMHKEKWNIKKIQGNNIRGLSVVVGLIKVSQRK